MAKTKETKKEKVIVYGKRWQTWMDRKCNLLHRLDFKVFLRDKGVSNFEKKIGENKFDEAYALFMETKKQKDTGKSKSKKFRSIPDEDENLKTLWERIREATEITDEVRFSVFREYLENKGLELHQLRNLLLRKDTLDLYIEEFDSSFYKEHYSYQSE